MSTNSGKRIRIFLALAAAAFGIVQVGFWLLPGLFVTWDSQVVDRFFVVRSALSAYRPAYDRTVVHVDLNNTAIQQLKTFYPTRAHYAQVIRNLASMRTAAQAYDLIFPSETNPADDQAIISATADAGNVYFGMAFALVPEKAALAEHITPETHGFLDGSGWKVRVEGDMKHFFAGAKPLITFSPLARAARGLGFLSLQTDRDGVIRRVPLLVRCGDVFYPSLPFRVVCDYLGVAPDRITVHPGQSILLEGARRPGGAPHDIAIPIDRQGNMIVNFVGPWGAMRHHNFAQVYAAAGDREELELWTEDLAGKIAVVSDVSTGAADIGPVPVDIHFPLSGLHANVIHTILSGNFLNEVSRVKMLAVDLALVLALLVMALKLPPLFFFGGFFALLLGYGATALFLFLDGGLLLPVVRPLLAIALSASLMTGYRYFQDEKERAALQKSFESYFPPSVVKRILANPAQINRGQRKELSILFSDIKDFTAHSSTLSPDRIRGFLNDYFETMVDVVFAHKGTVDKYIGDGLMVFFGDPEPLPDHALRSVQAAVAMQEKARELSEKWAAQGGFPVHIRVGINTGEVVVGNMGSSRRLSYTVLGSAVNLAKRLESSAPVNGILISQRTCDLLEDHIRVRSFGKIQVKGIEEPVSAYEVIPGGNGRS